MVKANFLLQISIQMLILKSFKTFSQNTSTFNFSDIIVSVLFVDPNSIYFSIPNLDIWDKKRDAYNYSGSHPIIAHPPCRLFSKLRHFSTAPLSEKNLAYFSLYLVRKNGGVLEHPAYSTLWKEKKLPMPGQYDSFGGWTLSLPQFWFGHPCMKPTWLYICGLPKKYLPVIPLKLGVPPCVVSWGKYNPHNKKPIRSPKSAATPLQFAEFLITIARLTTLVPPYPTP